MSKGLIWLSFDGTGFFSESVFFFSEDIFFFSESVKTESKEREKVFCTVEK